jgi:hypothetical protein
MVVVSHAHKFIFIKTLKTAGTSVEACLSKCLPVTDSLSPVEPPVDCHFPRNWRLPNGNYLYNHMPISEVMEIYGSKISDYSSWCIERHPIDKCISHYAMLANSPEHNKGNELLSWSDYVERRKFPIDTGKWSIDGSVIVGTVFDYRLISTQVPNYLKLKFGLSGFSLDVRAKSGFRTGRVPLAEEVTAGQREVIMKAFEFSNVLLSSKGLNFG